jgi:TIR domain
MNAMTGRDPHQALKTEVIGQARSTHIELRLAKLQWGKVDIGFSLHAIPHTFSTAGIQATDFLSMVGFARASCSFFGGGECYVRWTTETFDTTQFAQLFDKAFSQLQEAQRHLERCGIRFDQPEGWGYFFGKQSGRTRHGAAGLSGDGHTALTARPMKQTEDANFLYRFTWLVTGQGKGWVTHYRPKHLPLSSELQSVFKFLGLQEFAQCSEFDFEPCRWRSIEKHGDEVMLDRMTEFAHTSFDAHVTEFSPGVEKLLAANASIEASGLTFLPFSASSDRLEADIERKTSRPSPASQSASGAKFDVAISFAGPERASAEALATRVRDAGFAVFYDNFYPEELWGKNLVDTFDEIYRKRARYCVIFASNEYKERIWTNHERRSAQARALEEKGNEYILPIKVEGAELDGMPPTVGHLSLSMGIDQIADLLIQKLKSRGGKI